MSRVIVRRADYEYKAIRSHIFAMMESFDGGRIDRNCRVLIKPNLLAPASPDRAMLTHPMVVRAVAEYVIDQGARPQISDSPAAGFFDRVLKESGIVDALRGLNVEFKEFKSSFAVAVGEPFNRLELAEDAVKADMIINLPKLKTHNQMFLTLAVKNLFGCVVGLRKPEWHLRAGVDRYKFAQLLVRIHYALKPAVNILDGILAMEGQGPGRGGTPKYIGVLMASDDAVALDETVCAMFGVSPEILLTNKAARDYGIFNGQVQVDGELPDIIDFKLPEMSSVVFGPQCIHEFLRKYLVQRPVADDSLCRLCGECWSYCPAEAISHDRKNILFDYDKCIRCYCCLEVCPHGVLRAEVPLPGRILNKLFFRDRAGKWACPG
jgi:uncharacterized protein (DUF362 family)/Pyruvate/2-oxoacid:ferredoxin oxidoreductase delta subunit